MNLELGLTMGFQVLPALFINDGNCETNVFKTSRFDLGSMLVRLFDQRHFCFATLYNKLEGMGSPTPPSWPPRWPAPAAARACAVRRPAGRRACAVRPANLTLRSRTEQEDNWYSKSLIWRPWKKATFPLKKRVISTAVRIEGATGQIHEVV